MIQGTLAKRRKPAERKLNCAAGAVIERLEERLFLSTHRHRTFTPHESLYSGATIRIAGGAPIGYSPTQIRHLYGLDALDTPDPSYPLFTNTGELQTIVVIGAPAAFMNDVPMGREGNINMFHDTEAVKGPKTSVFEVPLTKVVNGTTFTFDPTTNIDFQGEVETAMELEWAYAMAPFANLVEIQVPTVTDGSDPNFLGSGTPGVVSAADMTAAIQNAIQQVQLESSMGPINQFGPGGVILIPLATLGEDPKTTAAFDNLFNYKYARNISFIAPEIDRGGIVSMPANSPFVTGVGGTVYDVGGIGSDGTRVSETASLNSGGGPSQVEPLPAYQQGIRVGGRLVTSRAGPDIVLASQTRGLGVNVVYDPTPMANAPVKWFDAEGTSVSASIFAGMVADADELRASLGLVDLGRGLNAAMYAAFKTNPGADFTDITQGNNTGYPALPGFDFATGMGAPSCPGLIPGLAGVVLTASTNITATGDQIGSLASALSGNAITPFSGKGFAKIGTQAVGLNLTMSTLATDQNATATATVTFPTLSRNLDNSLVGDGTVSVTGFELDPVSNTIVAVNTIFQVEVTGRVLSTRRGRHRISGSIFTIDANGNRVKQGISPIFEAMFTT